MTHFIFQHGRCPIKAICVAGVHSGVGKTTVTLGLMACLRRRGLAVAGFKVGPDFIDPGHHGRILGSPSTNLDGWMLDRSTNRNRFFRRAAGADIAVVEGVMGLYDGYDGKTEDGSTAQIAKWLGIPVLLVADARHMARSAAALVLGFERFDPEVSFVGVVFNHLGSERHLTYLREALDASGCMPCIGGLLRSDGLGIPERHLGLLTADEFGRQQEQIDRLANTIEAALDINGLLEHLPDVATEAIDPIPEWVGKRVRIAVARDEAFCFYYPDNLELLEASGAELAFFSPMTDDGLPEGTSGIYMGGGYPEMFGERLSHNERMREAIHSASLAGMPIYAECGGFMYLCREIVDLEGRTHPMCGCFSASVRMLGRLKALGYREVSLTEDTCIGKPGDIIRGHEFHYSELTQEPDAVQVYRIADRSGAVQRTEGYRIRNTLGSYIHLLFASHPDAARQFTASAMRYCAGYC
ncbi:MAG: cobyrinate a,c-diamide synthase [Thermodesulfobacteriota bacterium]